MKQRKREMEKKKTSSISVSPSLEKEDTKTPNSLLPRPRAPGAAPEHPGQRVPRQGLLDVFPEGARPRRSDSPRARALAGPPVVMVMVMAILTLGRAPTAPSAFPPALEAQLVDDMHHIKLGEIRVDSQNMRQERGPLALCRGLFQLIRHLPGELRPRRPSREVVLEVRPEEQSSGNALGSEPPFEAAPFLAVKGGVEGGGVDGGGLVEGEAAQRDVQRARRNEFRVARQVGAVGVEPELVELAPGGRGGAAAQVGHRRPPRAVAERVLRPEQVFWRRTPIPAAAASVSVAAHGRGGVARPLAGLVGRVDVQGGAGGVREGDVEVEAEEVVAGLVDVDLF